MSRSWPLLLVLLVGIRSAHADDVLHRYEGDVHPLDPSTGWVLGNPCDGNCSEFLEDGHFVFLWAEAGDLASYAYRVTEPPAASPSTLWVEWRFRSNHPLGPIFTGCDALFSVNYIQIGAYVNMYGDAVISDEGGDFVLGLAIDEFHTYRFESTDGVNYRFSVDGTIFLVHFGPSPPDGYDTIQLIGRGGCSGDQIPNMKHEWDFVRFGTISFGETIVASDPPSGYLDPAVYSNLDRFTVTFDSANYVYIDEITVEVTGGIAPEVIQTLRRETDDVDTVEVVLDRPLPMGELTRFIFNDGEATNVIEYWFDATVSGACCNTTDGSCLDLTSAGCTAVTEATYLGDETSCQGDNNSDGHDDACDDLFIIPTLSSWGLIILTLLTLTGGSVILSPRPRQDS